MAGLRRVLPGIATLLLVACAEQVPDPGTGPRVSDLLGETAGDGFARALPGSPLRFPEDHGPHPDYRSEWWYFTGNLDDAAGRHFGFQLTFFRFAMAPPGPERASKWATRQAWMAHLAVSDPEGGRFLFRERLARGALGLAGGRAAPLEIWLEDWRAESTGDALLPLMLRAGDESLALDLSLQPGKARVLQGREGYSRKGPEPGNASWYYSYTRLPARGRLTIAGERFEVAGTAWLDREWSTSALGAGVEGWDWFALQLDDGSELMYYRLRRTDGSADPASAGTLVDPQGQVTRLAAAEVEPVPRAHWRSPASGVRYPVVWTLAIPSAGLTLEVEPWLRDQEMNVSVRYWEGAVRVRGTRHGRAVGGNGYLELAGYAVGNP